MLHESNKITVVLTYTERYKVYIANTTRGNEKTIGHRLPHWNSRGRSY